MGGLSMQFGLYMEVVSDRFYCTLRHVYNNYLLVLKWLPTRLDVLSKSVTFNLFSTVMLNLAFKAIYITVSLRVYAQFWTGAHPPLWIKCHI